MEESTLSLVFEIISDAFRMIVIVIRSILLAFMKFFYTSRKDLSGEIVLLTGASGALGSLLAEKLVKRGCILVLWDINEIGVTELAKNLNKPIENCKAYGYKCDIMNENEVEKITSQVIRDVGQPTILINNAAIVNGKYFSDLSQSDITKAFEVNTLSHYRLVRMFLPYMLEHNHGHVVSTSSILALESLGGVIDYGPSKAGATAFMQSLRQEIRCLGKDKVFCTTILPYQIHTDMFKGCSARFTKLPFLSILDPDYVTSKMIDAIEKNQVVMYIPRILYFIMVLSSILPISANDAMHDFLRTNTAMKTWRGRNPYKKD